ncbi:cinnamoyl-CoA reductase-like SNL6 isoform X1 [Benincasa hispida]|uniref:cinnamoyl-CoA reductase-like SNL6 isoform X1 n=1 Tax=Benincasa hispida TaxID=102211 RepID=UPI0019009FF1|nr:cinnamoyl-CoA reductase-like SNL6 isoform X1 [Benincasa hispida]
MAPSSPHNTCNAVCVMDASTPLGTALVHRLLHLDFTVHAAIHTNMPEFMFDGFDDNKKLKIFHSDPFDYHSILDALRGCCGLFYTFDPPQHLPAFHDEMMMMMMEEEEVRAAHNVLEACAQIETIDKVVFTSSVTAVIWGHHHPNSTSISHLDERFWSDVHFCRKFKLWHGLSKTLAEKTAWALAMDRGVNMVSVNAGLLVGPGLTIDHPYLNGAAEMYEGGLFVTVDLNYLVDAHIRVFKDLSSYGRYICFNHIINTHDDAVDLARKLTPLPLSEQQQYTTMIPQRISNKKLNKLLMNSTGGDQID